MDEVQAKYTPYIDEKTFDVLITKARSAEYNKRGGNSKCAIIDNYAILKTGNIPGHDNSFPKMIETLHILHKSGINVVPILGYAVVQLGKAYPNGKRYDKGYIVQERAKGKELLSQGELFRKSESECRQIVSDYLNLLQDMPQEHYDKWVNDYKQITDVKVAIDPSKESNFFYDKEKGFSFIDLNFFSEEKLFDKIDSNGEQHYTEFILYTIVPFRGLFNGAYTKYFQTSEDLEHIMNLAIGCFNKYLQAVKKLGISRSDVELAFNKYNISLPKLAKEPDLTC